MLESVLVAVDLLPGSKRVVDRVAALPFAEGARVTLLHAVPGELPAGLRRHAQEDAEEALAALAERLPRARGVEVSPVVAVGDADQLIASRATHQETELLVVGRVGARSVREVFIGSTAERVVRRGAGPTLVVRLPARGPYARPLLALDDDGCAKEATRAALRVLGRPLPALQVVHAYEAPFQGLAYPSLTDDDARAYRDSFRREAMTRLRKQLDAGLGAEGRRATLHVHAEHGAPRTVIPEAVGFHRADLLVLGTQARGDLARVFLGTVAGDVLREVHCDVLVVPPARRRR